METGIDYRNAWSAARERSEYQSRAAYHHAAGDVTTSTPDPITSLRRRLDLLDEEDPECIPLLLDSVEALACRDRHGEARDTCQEALRRALAAGDTEGAARARYLLAILDSAAGNHSAAYESLYIALQSPAGAIEETIAGRICMELGVLHAFFGSRRPSRDAFEEAVWHFRGAGDTYLEARALANLAALIGPDGDIERALQYASYALLVFEEVEDDAGVTHALLLLADLQAAAGHPELALAAAEWALQRSDMHRSEELRAAALATIGTLCARLGRHDECLRALETALEVLPPWTELALLARIHLECARAYEREGNISRAYQHQKHLTSIREHLRFGKLGATARHGLTPM